MYKKSKIDVDRTADLLLECSIGLILLIYCILECSIGLILLIYFIYAVIAMRLLWNVQHQQYHVYSPAHPHICVHVHACLHTHVCVHIHACLHTHVCVHGHACLHTHVGVCVWTRVGHSCYEYRSTADSKRRSVTCLYTCRYTHLCTQVYTQVCRHVYTRLLTYPRMIIGTDMCDASPLERVAPTGHAHTHACAHAYAHVHTRVSAQVCASRCPAAFETSLGTF